MPNRGYVFDNREQREWMAETAIDFRSYVRGRYSAPESIDPRGWMRVENQGSMGSCQGHALSSVGEFAYRIATGEIIQFSPMWAYLETQRVDGLLGGDHGSTISGGLKCAQTVGLCPLENFPYPNPVRYSTRIPDGAREAAEPFKIRSHAFCTSYADVFEYLASGQGAVEIGISWGKLQISGDTATSFGGGGGGGHALFFGGYLAEKDANGRNILILGNSWGPDWNGDGWVFVLPSVVDQMCRDSNTVMIGMSDLTTPTPRKVDWADVFC